MNKIYRLIWSRSREMWIAVSEKVAAGWFRRPLTVGALVLSALLAAGGTAKALDPHALPTGGQVVAGTAAISQAGSAMTINQHTDKMIANWNTFNIGQNASVAFRQPGAGSVALNRILDQNPSQIFGSLTANGQIFLINPAGIYFGPTAQVDVGGIVASSLNLSNENFLAGKYIFDNVGIAGTVSNQGTIRTASGGYVAFLSPKITNEGTIGTPGGMTALAAGDKVSLDFTGDKLVTFTIDQGAIEAQVANKGLIQADGGLVMMSAKAADELTRAVVNNEGVVEAKGINNQNGRIILDAEGGQTTISGILDTSSDTAQGGRVVATGDRVLVKSGALLTASGATGGGEVLVGGGWQGKDPEIRQAVETIIEAGATLQANATDNGNGGTVVAWSDVTNPQSVTRAYGTFEAKGGPAGGDGGRIETSGYTLDTIGSFVTAEAPRGKGGLWLLDPADSTVSQAVADGYAATLNTGTSVSNEVTGSITISNNVSLSKTGGGDATLTFKATDNITLGTGATISSTSGKLNTIFWSDTDANGGYIALNSGSQITTNGGHLWMGGGSGTADWNGLTVGDGYATGNATQLEGIYIDKATITTSGGNVALYGKSHSAGSPFGVNYFTGVAIGGKDSAGSALISSDAGSILIDGYSQITTGTGSTGIQLGYNGAETTVKSTSGNITLIGVSELERGITLQFSATVAATAGGNVTLDGTAKSGNNFGISINNNGGDYAKVLANSGLIKITATRSGSGNDLRQWGAIGSVAGNPLVSASSSNIEINANSLQAFNDTTTRFRSTGTLTMQPRTAGTTIGIAGGAGTLSLPASYFSTNFTDGFSGITIGSATAGAITVGGATTFNDSTTLLTNSTIAVNGAVTANENLTLTGNGTITQSAALTVTGTTGITAGAGNNITLDNSSNDFTGAVSVVSGNDLTLKDANALPLGTAAVSGNLAAEALGGNLTLSGNISKASGADATATFKATGNIILTSTKKIESASNKLNTILWSDTDANGGGILLNNNSTITTNGGHLWMGGGSGTADWNGLTVGDGYALGKDFGIGGSDNYTGVLLGTAGASGISLQTSGGDIALYGQASTELVAGHKMGIHSLAGATINSGTGKISLDGKNTNTYNAGSGWKNSIEIVGTTITSANAASDAISINGDSSTADAKNDQGIYAVQISGNTVISATAGGGVSLTGKTNAGSSVTDKVDFYLKDASILADSGPITITGLTSQGIKFDGNAYAGYKSGSAIEASSSNIAIMADKLTLAGTDRIQSSGALTVKPYSATTIGIAGGAGTLSLPASYFADNFTNGFSGITIGSASAGNITIGNNALTYNDPLTLKTAGNIVVGNNASMTGTAGQTAHLTLWADADNNNDGYISTASTSAITSNGGNITLGGGTDPATDYAVGNATQTSGVNLLGSLNAGGGNISVRGQGLSSGGTGIFKNTATTIQTAGTGTIDLYGTGYVSGLGIYHSSGTITASNGNITLDGTANNNAGAGQCWGIDFLSNSSATTANGNISLIGRSTDATKYGTSTYLSTLSTTGTGSVTQQSVTGKTWVGTLTTTGSGNVTINAASTIERDASAPATQVGGNLIITANGAINDPGQITVTGTTSITAGAGNYITLSNASNDFTGAVSVVSGNNISIVDSNAMTLGAVNSTGLIDIATLTGNLTLTGAVQTTNATANAIKLNAEKDKAAGDGTGGNILIAGGSVSVGAGGRATLLSGDVGDSTGLTTLVGSGSGNFRYNSDETNANYSTALGTGTYAIYREQPTLTVTADDKTVTYGTAPVKTTSLSGLQNGDTSAQAVSTGAGVAVGGSTSASGNYIAGAHTLTPSGAAGGLGYGFSYTNGTLTVNQKSITATGVTASDKVYNANTTASINTGAAGLTGGAAADDDNKYYTGDTVTLEMAGATGAFADKNVGSDKAVTISGLALSGADAGNYTVTDASNATATITAKAITATGVTASDKVYNANTTASINTGAAGLTGGAAADDDNKYYTGDTVTLEMAGATGAFADKNVGSDKAVTISGLALSGADAGNYTVTDASNATATITAKAITATGVTASDKVYNANTTASINTGAAGLTGGAAVYDDNKYYTGDTVTLEIAGATGAFADKNVGSDKAVTVSGLALSGEDAGNYTVTDASNATATITAKAITATGVTASDKVYNANTTASINTGAAGLTGGAAADDDKKYYDGDTVILEKAGATGAFADKNVDNNKAVTVSGLALSGEDAGNYTVTDNSGATANITAKAITSTGITASNKVYNANTVATLNTGTAVLTGGAVADDDNKYYTGDTVTLDTSGAAGLFADKTVANNKAVTISGLTLSGEDAGNYTVTDNSGATANITAKAITSTGITASGKIYNANTVAGINTGSAVLTGGAAADGDNKYYTGDDVTLDTSGAAGLFADKTVANNKAVTISGLALSGADAGNYTVTDASNATANITAKPITATGVTAVNKIYNANTVATLNTGLAAITAGATADDDKKYYDGDTVILEKAGATGAFADKTVANNKAVTISGLTLSGEDAGNYTVTDNSGATANITAKAITSTGITASNKVYNANTVATLNTGTAVLTGGAVADDDNKYYTGDTVTLDTSGAAGLFADKTVANNKAVTISGLTLSGEDAGNYTVTDNSGATANITAKAITSTGITASNKVYNANTVATLNTGTAVLTGGAVADDDNKYYTGDTVTLDTSGAAGLFADKTVANNKAVTISGLALSGADAGNYTVTDASNATANITAKPITATGVTAVNKIYNANTVATLNTGLAAITAGATADDDKKYYTGDTVTLDTSGAAGLFADKTVANNKAVTISGLTLSGEDAGNYTVTDNSGATANITAKAITSTGITASGKIYNANTVAGINTGSAVLTGGAAADGDNKYYTGDDVTLDTSGAAGLFADKTVANNKAVTISGLALSGADAGNYTVTDASNATANITAKPITATGVTAVNKIYNANTVATLNTGLAAITAGATADDDKKYYDGDTVILEKAGATGAFADKTVANNKAVTISGLTLSGEDAGNYTVTDNSGATADITAKAITATGVTASDKVYNANTTATINTASASITAGAATDDDKKYYTGDAVALETAGATGAFADKHAGIGKAVTVSGFTLSGEDAGNYSVSDASNATADITAKAITVSGITASGKVYDAKTNATTDVTNATGWIAGDSFSVSATGLFDTKNVGTNKTVTLTSSYSGDDKGNYTISDQATTTADITAKAITIAGITASDKVYDAKTNATTDVTNATGWIAGDSFSVSATGLFDTKNVGTNKTVTLTSSYSGDDKGNYTISDQATTTANITAKPITIAGITASDKVYDAKTNATTDVTNATGWIAGDSFSVSATGLFDTKNVGTNKTVTLTSSYSGDDKGNYTISDQATTTADITAKAITIAGITASDKVYDAKTNATTDVTNATGWIAGDSFSVSATGLFDTKNVGTNKTVTLTSSYSGDDKGNYTISDQATTTANITAKPITIAGITASDKVYDAKTNATTDVTNATGWIAGDSFSVSATGLFDTKNVGTNKTVTLTSSYSGDDKGNYTISDQATTTADITAKAITIAGITASDKVYDAKTNATTDVTNATGWIAGDSFSVSATGLFDTKNVGTNKTVTLTSSYSGDDKGNYTISDQATTTADITAKAITIAGITASDKVYDAKTNATTDVTNATGWIAGDSFSVSATGLFDTKNVGTNKTVTLTSSYSGDDKGNYTISDQATTTADITAKAITIAGITASDKVYDAKTNATTDVTNATGWIAGDSFSVSATGLFDTKNVGTNKTVTLTSSYSGDDKGNYTISDQATTTADITAKAITIAGITASDKVYDAKTNATTDVTNATGWIAGDSFSVSATGLFDTKNVGTNKTVTLTSSYSGDDKGNYTISDQATTTANITAKPITIAGITASDKVYDAKTNATTDVTNATGWIAGDSFSVSATGLFDTKNVGTNKTVTLTSSYSGDDKGNYTISDQATTTANITAKPITIAGITAADKVYDAKTNATTDVTNATGWIAGDSFSVSATGLFDTKNVGTNKTVTLTSSYSGDDKGNYTISDQATTTANITAKPITIAGITASDKVYDAKTNATTDVTNATGWIAGDSFSVSATGLFDTKNVGTNKTVTLTSSYSGDDKGNYTISDQATTTANITAKPITIAGITASDKVYDAKTNATTDVTNATGWIAGDSFSVSATGLFDTKNVGTNKTVTLTSSYSGDDKGNYTISDQATTTANITAKPITIAGITAADKVYDAKTNATTDATNATGWIAGDSFSVSATGLFDTKNVGTNKTVTLTSSYSGDDKGNYTISDQATTQANITPAPLTVTAGDASKTYGETITFAGTEFTSNGLVGNETIGLVQLASAGAAATAGVANSPYAITASDASGGTFLPANYSIAYQNGALTVNKAALTVTANDDKKTFNSIPYKGGNGVVYAGFVNDETEAVLGGTLDYSGSSQGAIQAGTYNIDPLGLTSDNYAVTFNKGILTIEPPISVDPVAENKQSSNNGNDQVIGGNPAAPHTSAIGTGQGSHNIVMTSVMAGPSGSNVVISTPTFSTPVTLSSAGQTMTLTVVGATSAGPMTDVGSLPVFTSSGNSAPSLQGTFMLQQSGSAVSLTPAAPSGTAPSAPASGLAGDRSTPFTLTMDNGMTLQMTASVTTDGVLVISAPDTAGNIDVRQAILMGAQVAKQALNVELSTLSSALFMRN